jgi:hypothetical protein
MTMTVCVLARTLNTPTAGGHTWVYLNWAMGLRSLGCRVVWLEVVSPTQDSLCVQQRIVALKRRLAPFGLADAVALCSAGPGPLLPESTGGCLDLEEAAAEADLLVDMSYGPAAVIARFRRTALLDIDPGLCQLWVSRGQIDLPPHDVYFTIGETVGRPDALFPDCGLPWRYLPPCVALDWWPVSQAPARAPFTTVTNWIMYDYWVDDERGGYANDKRTGFLPFLDLPRHTTQPLELALSLGGAQTEREALEQRGWRVREAHEIVATPDDYQRYIQGSRGEFSCAKPSCVRLQNAWVSDRTLCYLASGKPAVVQHTGKSRFLPDAEGLFRFSTIAQAAQQLETVAADYGHQSRLARSLAEEYFDARRVTSDLLEQALD